MSNTAVHKVLGTTVRTIAELPPTVSAGGAKDLDEFIDLLAVALVDYQKRLSIAPAERLLVREEYPKDEVESPDRGISLALFKVVSRMYRNTTNDGVRRPRRPTHRETINHPDDSTLRLQVFALEMDNVVEIKIVSPHAKRANELALFFEKFMLAYAWYFKEMGIADLFYEERLTDMIEVIGGNELHVRPLRYCVRTQIVSQEVTRSIDEVLVHYDTGPALRSEQINETYGVVDHTIVHTGSNS